MTTFATILNFGEIKYYFQGFYIKDLFQGNVFNIWSYRFSSLALVSLVLIAPHFPTNCSCPPVLGGSVLQLYLQRAGV